MSAPGAGSAQPHASHVGSAALPRRQSLRIGCGCGERNPPALRAPPAGTSHRQVPLPASAACAGRPAPRRRRTAKADATDPPARVPLRPGPRATRALHAQQASPWSRPSPCRGASRPSARSRARTWLRSGASLRHASAVECRVSTLSVAIFGNLSEGSLINGKFLICSTLTSTGPH